MELSERELRILGDMLPENAYRQLCDGGQLDVIARREGVTRERIRQQASRITSAVLAACAAKKAEE